MEYVSCDICNSDDYTVLFEAGAAQINRIVKCNCCGLMYANPRIQMEYQLHAEKYEPDVVISNNKMRLDKESLQVRDNRSTRAFLNRYYPHKGKLVEIGSGFGYLLNFFHQDGWDVVGVELYLDGCQYTESKFGLKVIPSTIEKSGFNDNSVDVVLMMHVIEHVPSPSAIFKEVYRILKPGGLFVVETPRYDTLMFKLLGKRERSLSWNGHIYFFTTSDIKKMAAHAGFSVLKLDYVGRSLTLERLLWNIGVISKSTTFKHVVEVISSKLQFDKIWLHLNVRDMQRVYLKKP
jgi:2-polyprenyl-3-methyl-5-hydroxy-6-metoxy-1,4-benzoquinol methylase